MLNAVFEILVWAEIAAIAGVVGLAFAPVSFWDRWRIAPPVWTQAAARPRAGAQEQRESDDPLALSNIMSSSNPRRNRLPFGEMG